MKSFRKSNAAVQTSLVVKSFILLVVSLLAISCSNMLGSQGESSSARGCETGSVSFTGTISVSGALPSSLCRADGDSVASRSALPSFTIGNDYYYYVTATQANGSDSVNKNSLSTPNPFTTTNGVTFALPLTNGNWNIEAGIKKANVSGIARADDVSVMSETYPVTISTANPVVSHTFYPKPSQEGSGNVALNISYDSGKVDSVTAKCGNESWTVSTSGTQATIQMDSIASGTYDLSIYFYKNDSNSNPILVYSTVQTINVFDNMTTNSWVSDGSGLISDTGVFNLTSTLINQFTRTTFYVGDTKVGTADETGSGSVYSPLPSVTKAVEVIAATGNSSKDYRIFVSGSIKGKQEIPSSITGKAQSLTIEGLNGLDENLEPNDVLDGNKNGTTLTINSSVPVTIKNLKITGGKNASGNGGGIYIASGSNVTLGTGALVGDLTQTTASATSCGNYASNGGGIYNEGSLTLGSGSIVRHNYASPFGGGIWNECGSVTIKDGAEISYNCAGDSNSRGGGIRSGGSGSSLKMEGGTISHNSVSYWGGGVMIQGSEFTMTGGTISFNKSTGGSVVGAGGGGIWIDDGTFKMSGDSILSGNEAKNKGGGIHVDHAQATVEILGGTISGNSASVSGGAISNNNGVITISGGTIENNSAVNGGAVNSAITFNIKGNPSIPYGVLNESGTLVKDTGKNDVYLPSGKVITVTGALTGTSPVATITPATRTRGTTVVQADDSNIKDLTNYKDSFVLTDSDWNTKLSADNKSLVLDAPIYVAGTGRTVCTEDGSDDTGNGTKSKPFATIAKAVEAIAALNTSADYTIYIDGTVTGAQAIGEALNGKASSLTIVGVNPLDSDGKPTTILNGNFTSSSLVGTTLTVSTSVSVTISNLKITGGNMQSSGGGIHNSASSNLTIASGSLVTGNKAGNSGGGICNLGTLTISSGEVSGNEAGYYGGGVYNSGTFTMTSGTISENTNTSTYYGGGGVSNEGTFNFQGGQIYENTAAGSMGGGIYNAGTLTMTAGTIEKNSARYGGGILCAEGAAFTMEGGSIRENTVSIYGGALYNAGTFNIKGSASIPYGVEGATGDGKNDVFLPANKYITVTGGLEGTSPIATISPAIWTRGITVVQADDSNITDLTNYKDSFVLTDSDWNTKLSADNKSLVLDAPIYVAGTGRTVCTEDGSDDTGNGTKSKPFATIAKAVEAIAALNTSADYTIYIDGTVTGAQAIGEALNGKASSLTIVGVNPLDSEGKPTDTLNGNGEGSAITINTSVSVTINNLKITGGTGMPSGAGIFNNSSGNLTLSSGCLVTGNSTSSWGNGGGVYNKGTLTITGAEISGNTCDFSGGGVNNEGTLIMSSGKISGNTAGTAGVGVYNVRTFKMTGGTISSNKSTGSSVIGAGVYQADANATFFMSGTAVIGDSSATENATNKKYSNYCYKGSGIYIASGKAYIGYTDEDSVDTNFTGGIYYNYSASSSNGGGIYIDSSAECYIAGGSIKFNGSATGKQKGVHVNGSLTLKGDITFATDNDIFVTTNKTVTVAGTLNNHSATNPITITPEAYTEGTQVLTAADGIKLQQVKDKFTLANSDDYAIDLEGKIVKLKTASEVVSLINSITRSNDEVTYKYSLKGDATELNEVLSLLNNNNNNLKNEDNQIVKHFELDLSECEITELPVFLVDSGAIVSLILPKSLTSLSNNALYNCRGIRELTIYGNIASFGDECLTTTNLTTFTMLDGSQGIIGNYFLYNSKLTTVYLPASLNEIGIRAIAYCSSSSINIYYEGTTEMWNAVTKGTGWNTSSPITVICSDGSVTP